MHFEPELKVKIDHERSLQVIFGCDDYYGQSLDSPTQKANSEETEKKRKGNCPANELGNMMD